MKPVAFVLPASSPFQKIDEIMANTVPGLVIMGSVLLVMAGFAMFKLARIW